MWWGVLAVSALTAFLWGVLWCTRRLMAWAVADEPASVRSQAELETIFGMPGMPGFDEQIAEYLDELRTKACFACGHLSIFHLDAQAVCTCCQQHELLDIEID